MPDRYMGAVMKLCLDKRGENSHFSYPVPGRIELVFELPLAEVIFDFYDKLKSVTQGYGSFDYEIIDYRPSELVKLDILVNGDKVDALAIIVHKDRAHAPRGLGLREAAQGDPASPLQDRHPGRDRRQDRRALDRRALPQGRHGQVLRRRHHPQAQAPREAGEGQEEDAHRRPGDDPAERLRGGSQDR